MNAQDHLGGTYTFPGTSMTVNRMRYGAMQLAGPHVFGPPKDPDAAIAVLRDAVESGINHIDTADFYGPHITRQIIKQALKPCPKNLTIITKLGATRGDDGSWILDTSPEYLRKSVHDNPRNLGFNALPIVNLRIGGMTAPNDAYITEPLTTLWRRSDGNCIVEAEMFWRKCATEDVPGMRSMLGERPSQQRGSYT